MRWCKRAWQHDVEGGQGTACGGEGIWHCMRWSLRIQQGPFSQDHTWDSGLLGLAQTVYGISIYRIYAVYDRIYTV